MKTTCSIAYYATIRWHCATVCLAVDLREKIPGMVSPRRWIFTVWRTSTANKATCQQGKQALRARLSLPCVAMNMKAMPIVI